MSWRKIAAMICAVGMLGTALVGCASPAQKNQKEPVNNEGTKEQDPGTETETVSGKVTLWFNSYSLETPLNNVIAGFNQHYPDVEVELQIKDGNSYFSLLSTALQSGEGPDMFYTNGTADAFYGEYVKNGYLADLSNLIDDWSIFGNLALKRTTYDGKIYGIPWMKYDSRAVYYNKDIFEANGWKVPTTLDELEAIMEAAKAEYVPVSACTTDAFSLLFIFEPLLAAMHPDYVDGLVDGKVDLTGTEPREALDKLVTWADKGYFGENYLGVADGSEALLTFTSGNAAMYIGGTWDTPTLAEANPNLKLGAFILPGPDGNLTLCGSASQGPSVNAASVDNKAVMAFAKYCTTLEAQQILVQGTGELPSNSGIVAADGPIKEIADQFSGDVGYSYYMAITETSNGENAISTWSENFPKIMTKEKTVDELLAEMKPLIEAD